MRLERTQFYGVNYRDARFVSGKKSESKALEAADLNNILLLPGGGVRLRPGRAEINTSEYPELPHSISWYVDTGGTKRILLESGKFIYDAGDGIAVPVLSHTLDQPDHKCQAVSFMGFFWRCDGTNDNLKFDGTDWTSIGIERPAAPPVLAEGGAGPLTGDFNYVYVYVYKNVALGYESESAACDLAEITGVAGKDIEVTGVADPTGEATNIRIYRRSSTAATYKQVAELANANFTYTDNTAEGDLDDDEILVGEHEGAPPVELKGIVKWKRRLWGWKDNILYYTKEDQPEKWWSIALGSDWLPWNIDVDNNDTIIGVFADGVRLLVWTSTKMFEMSGESEENFFLQQVEGGHGLLAQRSPARCDGFVLWLAPGGVYAYDGLNQPYCVSLKINRDFEGSSRGLLDAFDEPLTLSEGVYISKDKTYWLSVPKVGGLLNARTFVFFEEMWKRKPTGMYEYLSPWSIYDFGFAASCMADEDRLFTCDSMSSYYVLERTGKTELDASNVTGYYEFKHWDFGMPEVDKFLDDITVVSWTTGNPIVFKTLFAGDGWSETSTFSISKQGALWYDPTQAEPDRWGPSSRIPPSRWGGPSVNPYHTDYEQEMVGTYIGWRMELDKDGYVNSFVHAQIFTEAGNYS